jgi:hypothetical protein
MTLTQTKTILCVRLKLILRSGTSIVHAMLYVLNDCNILLIKNLILYKLFYVLYEGIYGGNLNKFKTEKYVKMCLALVTQYTYVKI